MNKLEMIQKISDKTELEEAIVKKVLDACEDILAETLAQKIKASKSAMSKSSPKKQNAKIVDFHNPNNSECKRSF